MSSKNLSMYWMMINLQRELIEKLYAEDKLVTNDATTSTIVDEQVQSKLAANESQST
jgi:hypothetical protein